MYFPICYARGSSELLQTQFRHVSVGLRCLHHHQPVFCLSNFCHLAFKTKSCKDIQSDRSSCSKPVINTRLQTVCSVDSRSPCHSQNQNQSALILGQNQISQVKLKQQTICSSHSGSIQVLPKLSYQSSHPLNTNAKTTYSQYLSPSHRMTYFKCGRLNFGTRRLHNYSYEKYRSYTRSCFSTNTPGVEKWKHGTQPELDMKYFLNIGDFEDKLYDYLCDANGRLPISKFKKALLETGLRESDPRLEDCMRMIRMHQAKLANDEEHGGGQQGFIDREYFKECISKNIVVLSKAFRSHFIIPNFSPFCQHIDEIYWKARDMIGGKVATYIPQLARYSPNFWGVSVCTVDGQRYSLGDVNVPFSIQSVSKPLTYSLVLDELSPEVVHQYVGHEPSGVAFNSIALDYTDKPHNPMVNAGAIIIGSLLKQELPLPDRFDYVSLMLKRLAGGEHVAFNNSVFLSERETADRNFALAYYMREKKCFPDGTNLMEVMDFYFQLCSIEVTCESGSVMAATLANGGICPITGDKVLSSLAVRDTLSLMHSCGMYDYSGEFAFKVGLPAKSGVSGGILLVVPNVMGIFLWSPALDKWGNSVRGVQFCQDLVGRFNFHNYDNLRFTSKKIDPCKRKRETQTYDVVNLLFGAYNGDVSALRRFAMRDVNMNLADYDGRTALHIGAAEGHEGVVRFLLEKCKCNPFVVDRWGSTPDKDAERFGHNKVATIIQKAMKQHHSQEQ